MTSNISTCIGNTHYSRDTVKANTTQVQGAVSRSLSMLAWCDRQLPD